MRRLLVVGLAVCLGGALAAKEEPRLQGQWRRVAGINDGKPLGGAALDVTLTIAGNRFALKQGNKVINDGVIRLGSRGGLATIDLRAADPATRQPSLRGIFRFEGDRLLTCFAPARAARPATFEAESGSRLTVMTWERPENARQGPQLPLPVSTPPKPAPAPLKTVTPEPATAVPAPVKNEPKPGASPTRPTEKEPQPKPASATDVKAESAGKEQLGKQTVSKTPNAVAAANPVVVLQVRSVHDLLDSLNTAAKNFLPEAALKDFETNVLSTLDVNRLEGVDVKKPFGLCAAIGDGARQGDFAKSSVVVLVPVSDTKAFVDSLEKFGLRAEKQGDEYVISLPIVPFPASLRFLKGYAYICLAMSKVDAAALLDPQAVFSDKQSAAAVLHLHMDRLPDDLRKQFLARFTQDQEQRIEATRKSQRPADNPPTPDQLQDQLRVETAIRTTRWFMRWIKLLVNDGMELIFRIDLDPQTGVLGTEMIVEPRNGSELAKSIGEVPPSKNDFARIAGADSAAQLLIQAPLYIDDLREMLAKSSLWIAQSAEKLGVADAPRGSTEAVSEAYKAIGRTVNEGKLDFAVSLRGPDKGDRFTAIGAISLKDTALLEKSLRTVAKSVPMEMADLIKLDAFKVGGVNVHEIAVGQLLPPDAQKVFGKSSAYVGLAPDAVFVAFGSQGKEAITEVLGGKPGRQAAPLLQAEISAKRVLALFKTLGAGQEALQFIEKLTAAERSPVMAIKVQSGEKLTLRVEVGLPALWIVSPKASR